MPQLRKGIFYRLWDVERGPYGLLVLTVLSTFVASPLVVMGVLRQVIVDVFLALFMFAGVLTVSPRTSMRYLTLLLAIVAVLTQIATQLVPSTGIMVAEAVIEVTLIGIFAALVMKQFLVPARAASHRIGAAIVVYLLLGVLWSRVYYVSGMFIPTAFQTPGGAVTINTYVYFSFVTLATVGYGDMSPVHPLVRNLAVLEAITGQMYIAVLIARLVSTSDERLQR